MHKIKERDDIIFMDKEPRLARKPDIIARWESIPFPDNYFHCVIFDPPHFIGETTSYAKDPSVLPNGSKRQFGWYGCFKTRHEAVSELIKAQREIARVSPRMCLKWSDQFIPLHNILGIFDNWLPQFILIYKAEDGRGSRKLGDRRGCRTWWVKLVRKPVLTVFNEDREEVKG